MNFSQKSNLFQRLIISSIASIVLLIVIALAYTPPFQLICTGAVAAATGVALWEYYQIGKAKNYSPLLTIAIVFSTLYIGAVYLATQYPAAELLPFATLGTAFLAAFLTLFFQENSPLGSLAITAFGFAYLVIPLGLSLSILYFFPADAPQDGRWWLVYAIAVTKLTDTGAFFTGKKWGKHRLATHISPQKTIEGSIGGLLCAILASFLLPNLATLISSSEALSLSFGQSLFLGLVIGLLAQIGDLGESLLKRDAGIKDSNQLPGLGGMLDIVDSLIFTLPFVYLFLRTQY